MKIAIVPIGNSKGVRLPKALLEQAGLTDTAELTLEEGRIVLSAPKAPRQNWAAAFANAPELMDEDREWLDAHLDADADQ